MSRKYHLLTKFGLTEEQYESLLSGQQGCCAVCRRPAEDFKSKLAVDHDHLTGEVRGLLCFRCNKFRVGRNRRGVDTTTLQRVVEYLDREYTGWVVPPKKKRRKKRAKKRLARKSKLQRTRPSKHPSIHPTIVQL